MGADTTGGTLMTEAFVAIVAMMIAVLGSFATAVVMSAAFTAWRDWQRERASLNCEVDRSHRLDGIPKPRF
jgi:hypothetical protein